MSKTYLTIKNIRNRISNTLTADSNLQNLTIKCIVKKTSQYPYVTYVDVCDIDDLYTTITATITNNYLKEPIKVNDVIVMSGNITLTKGLNFKILNYYHDKPQESNYDKIICKLKDEGLYDAPKPKIPMFIFNVAIISSVNAAGLKDCLDIISSSPLNNIYIYPVTLQGTMMKDSVISAIKECNKDKKVDLILLVRGGGSKTDLEWFDNFDIAKEVIRSKIPIICGIGHEIDHTIMDIVCSASYNTPTHVATVVKSIATRAESFLQMLKYKYEAAIDKYVDMAIDIDKVININMKKQIIHLTNCYNNKKISLCEKYERMESAMEQYTDVLNNNHVILLQNKLSNLKHRLENYIHSKIAIRAFSGDKELYTAKEVKEYKDIELRFMDETVKLLVA